MKNLTVLLLCLVFISTGCKKEEKAPTPAPTPTPATPTMTTTETALVGKWYWDQTEVWNAGTLSSTYDATTGPSAGCTGTYMDLKSSKYNGTTSTPQQYDNIFVSCGSSPTLTVWAVQPNFPNQDCFMSNQPPFASNALGYFEVLTSTNLVLHSWSGSIPDGTKSFYHK